MTALLSGLAMTVAYVVGLVGLRLLRSPADATEDRALTGRTGQLQGAGSTSLVARLRRRVGARFGPLVLRSLSTRARARLEHHLDAAGRPGRASIHDVAATKAADTAVCLVIGVGALSISPVLLPLVVLYGFHREDLQLRAKARVRQARIERDLPDYLDVLAVTIHAGLKFRGALRRVGEQLESPVSDELRVALQQMDVGASRRAAFEGVRERNDSQSLHRFIGALLQAEELGVPLTDAMDAISADMRKSYGQAVRKRAAEAVPKVTLVATMLLMPGAALLLLGGLFIGSGIDLGSALGG